MAPTIAAAYGRLEMDYTAYGHPHVFRVWVHAFNADPGVGTFTVATSPVSLDALATELTVVIKPLYESGSGLAWGAWRGLKTTQPTTGAGIPVVEGTITPGSASFSAAVNTPGAVSEGTWSFRDSDGAGVKHVMIGLIYAGSVRFVYSSLSTQYKNYADYVTGSAVINARSANVISSFINLTFDTNDGLQRKYRG